MKWMTTLALLAATVATAVVGVCEFTQVRSLQYRVWNLERRRDKIERRIQRVGAAARARRTPRSILAAPGRLPGAVVPLAPTDDDRNAERAADEATRAEGEILQPAVHTRRDR